MTSNPISPGADSVMAATYKLVRQAMSGQWQDVPKTVEERRVMLDKLSATASPQDQQWLTALRQAMAESDAAVAKMAGVEAQAPAAAAPSANGPADPVGSMMEMLRRSR